MLYSIIDVGDIMKKLILLIPILILLTGCGKVATTDYEMNDGLIIKYTENDYEFEGLQKKVSNSYVIEVYSDRTIKYGSVNSPLKEKKLSVSKFNKLITLAFSDEFYDEFFKDVETEDVDPSEVDLTKDIGSKDDKKKGKDSYVYIFSTGGGVIAVGGQDADNPMYNKLVKLITKYGK